jgi:hypothetical protein
LSEGKFSKYLFYALGEIILVVIGILIAVSINNWNEDRKNAISEHQLISSLRKDMLLNQAELQRVLDKSVRTRLSSDSLLKAARHEIGPLTNELLTDLIVDGTNFTIYTTHEGTIQDIMGSGKLDLIRNDSIRLAIASWNVNLRHLREWETIERNSSEGYMKYLQKNLDMYKRRPDSLLTKEIEEQIFNDRIFLNRVANRSRLPGILNEYYQMEVPKLERLLGHLEKEMKTGH